MTEYRVDLDVYNGPLDLLLFLIQRDEVDIHNIPVAEVLKQYITYIGLLEQIDPDAAGDFLVMASTLMEIKSRMLLPKPPAIEEEEDTFEDPRLELVRQLLAYKTFKDAAAALDTAAQIHSLKHPRQPVQPELRENANDFDIDEVHVWDLLDAFKKLLEQTGRRSATHNVTYDDTPIALHAEDILDSLLRAGGSQPFAEIFADRSKSQMIGLFLALLELIRQRRVRATQDRPFAPILLHVFEEDPEPLEFEDEYTLANSPTSETPTDHSNKLNNQIKNEEPNKNP
jgi:segregation and condensation protein A